MFLSTIIVAGGSGKRFGAKQKKQFYSLKGKPVIVWSIEKFTKLSNEVIVILPREDVVRYEKKWCKIFPGLKIFPGGKERPESVKQGLNYLSPKCGLVCIHDGVRPLVSSEAVTECIRKAKKHGAAIVAVPAGDTVKISDQNLIKYTYDRNNVWLAQTPQIFKRDLILSAYKRKSFSHITDDAQLVEKLGHSVRLVSGEYTNLKITTKEDIIIAERLLKK